MFFPKISLAAPFNLTVHGDCTKSDPWAELSWDSATGTPPVTYNIYRRTDGGSWSSIDSTINLTYIDDNIDSDKTYDYYVKTGVYQTNVAGIGRLYCRPYFNEPTTECLSNGPRINLNWDGISGNLNTYKIWRKKQGESSHSVLNSTVSTSFSDGPNIEGYASYSYFIEAIWSSGYSTTSANIWELPAPACPPTINYATSCLLSAEPGGPRVSLSWNSLLGVSEYKVYQIAPGTTIPLFLASTTDTSYIDNLADSLPDQYYQSGSVVYLIKAIWPSGEKQSSTTVKIFPCSPFLEVNTVCESAAKGFMNLSWTGTLGADNYHVYRDNLYQTSIPGNSPLFYSQEIIPPTTSHIYKIVATTLGVNFNSNNVSKEINCVDPPPPYPPPILNPPVAKCETCAGIPFDSVITNSWSWSENTHLYYLFRDSTGEKYSGTNNSYTDCTVERNYNYNYTIKAAGFNATTEGNTVNITAFNCDAPAPYPNLVLTKGCDLGKPYVDLNWNIPNNAYSYEIFRLDPNTTSYAWQATLEDPNENYWQDAEISTSTSYTYKVIAKGPPGGPYTESNSVPITTDSCFPSAPVVKSQVNFCEGTSQKILLTWTADEINTKNYQIWRKDAGGPEQHVGDVTFPGTKQWIDSVGQNISYQYKVIAIGYLEGQSNTTGYNTSVISYYCAPPGGFELQDPAISCQNNPYSYPKAITTWSSSAHAIKYILNRHLYNNGTILGTTTLVAPVTSPSSPYGDRGQGYAISFSGDDYLNIGQPEELKTLYGLTIEFWIKPSRVNSFLGVLSSNSYWTASGTSFYLRSYDWDPNDSEQFRFSVIQATGTRRSLDWGRPDQITLEVDRWYHIVGTYDNARMEIWLDGNRKTYTTSNVGGTIFSPADWKIGAVGGIGNFRGEIDNVRIYNRRISSTEVAEHYQGIYNSESGLIGAWFFDEGIGVATETVSDSSNNRNDAVLWGTPTWVKNGIQLGSKYSWQISAYSNGPFPTLSSVKPASGITIPLSQCPPIKPGLKLTPDCENGKAVVHLDWSFSLQANAFEVWRKKEGGTDTLVKTIGLTDPEFTSRLFTDNNNNLGLATSTNYTYWIKSVGSGGNQDSDHLLIETPFYCGALAQPLNVSAQFQCSESQTPQVSLTWNAVYGAVWYDIFRQGDLYKTNITTNSFLDEYPYVVTNKNYYYSIIAYHYATNSIMSASSSVDIGYCWTTVPTTSVSTDCRYSDNKPINEITWEDNTFFNTAQYRIWRVDPGGGTSMIGTIPDTDSFALKPTNWTWGDYLKCENSEILGNDLKEQLTIELWMKPTEYLNTWGTRLMRKYTDTGDANFAFYYYGQEAGSDNGRISFYATRDHDYDGTPTWGMISPYSNSSLTLNKWYHVVLSYASSTGGYLYIDNVVQGTGPVGAGLLATNTQPILLGAFQNGLIDEVRIYKRALSANEVSEHYINKNYSNETGLVAHWRFNEGVGSVIRDSSGYNHICRDPYGENSIENAWQKLGSGDPTYNMVDTKFASNIRKFIDNGSLYPLSDSTNYNYLVEVVGQKGDTNSNPFISMLTYGCSVQPEVLNITNVTTTCFAVDEPYNTLSWTTTTNTLSSNIYRTVDSDTSVFSTRLSPFKDWASHVLSFDGTAEDNVWVSDSVSSIDGLSAMTIEIWFYLNQNSTIDHSLIDDDWINLHTFRDESFHLNARSTYVQYGCNTSQSGYIGHGVNLSKGRWYFMAGTFDMYQLGNNMKLYLDGELRSAKKFACGPLNYGSESFVINPGWHGTNDYLGLIDEVRIYSRALSAAEIAEHYNGIYKNETGLRLALHFDEGSGSIAYDSSGRNSSANVSVGNAVNWLKITGETDPLYKRAIHGSLVEENKTYSYQVRGAAQSRESDSADTSIDTEECGPWVDNFTATPQCMEGNPYIYLNWDAGNIVNVLYYKKRTASTTYDYEPYIPENNSFHYDSSVQNGISYDYYISIQGDGGAVATTAPVTAQAPNCQDPPTKPIITNLYSGCRQNYTPNIRVYWDTDGVNTSYFDILRLEGSCNGEFEQVNISYVGNNQRSYLDENNLNNLNNYCYKVRAVGTGLNNFSDSLPLATSTYNCDEMSPFPPVEITNLIPKVEWLNFNEIERKVDLYWSQENTNSEWFEIQRKEESGGWGQVSTTSGENYTYVDRSVLDGRFYYYQILGCNKNGCVSAYNQPGVDVPEAPPGPFILSGQWQTNNTIFFEWTDASSTEAGGEIKYQLFRSMTQDFLVKEAVSPVQDSTSSIDTSPSSIYPWYRVEAQNNGGTTYSNLLNMFSSFNLLWKEIKP